MLLALTSAFSPGVSQILQIKYVYNRMQLLVSTGDVIRLQLDNKITQKKECNINTKKEIS